MKVVLKECLWESLNGDLLVLSDPREVIVLADSGGHVAMLFTLLEQGPCTLAELRDRLALSEVEVRDVIEALDQLGLVERDKGRTLNDPGLDARHFSNLAFFGTYAGLGRSRADFVDSVRRSHVLVLGVGGGGSSIVQCLAGLGVGRLTLVDRDDVEPRNFARQFLYHHDDIGSSKVDCAAEWVRAYDPRIQVRPVDRWISGPDDLQDLAKEADIIVGGLDGHPEAHLWVNEAAMRAKVPLVVGGMTRSQITYYSVDPARGPCVQCDWRARPAADEPTPQGFAERSRVRISAQNLLIGPIAMQIGSLVAYEALRYLTGFEPPQAAGTFIKLDLRNGLAPERQPFTADPNCPLCAS